MSSRNFQGAIPWTRADKFENAQNNFKTMMMMMLLLLL